MPALCQDVCEVVKLRAQAKAPEWRALDQIVAEARAAGRQVMCLGPAGIFEIVGRNRDTAAGRSIREPREMGTTESMEVTENGTTDDRG